MSARKKVVVTGGAGYIGSALVPRLLQEGYEVVVFDKMIFGDFGLDAVKDQIDIVVGDILNFPDKLLNDAYAVIHLAALSTEPSSYYNPRLADLVNHIGTERVGAAAKRMGVPRFIYASTCTVYYTYDTGVVPNMYREDEKINTISPYALTKRMAELALLELADESFRPIIFRKGTAYGFAPRMRYDVVFNSFSKDAFGKKKIIIHANGEIHRALTDIQDAVELYVQALTIPLEKVGGEIFNVVSGNWSIMKLAQFFQDSLKKHRNELIEIEIQKTAASRNYFADVTKVEAAFSWKPVRDIEEALLELRGQLEEGHDYAASHFYNDIWQREMHAQGRLDRI